MGSVLQAVIRSIDIVWGNNVFKRNLDFPGSPLPSRTPNLSEFRLDDKPPPSPQGGGVVELRFVGGGGKPPRPRPGRPGLSLWAVMDQLSLDPPPLCYSPIKIVGAIGEDRSFPVQMLFLFLSSAFYLDDAFSIEHYVWSALQGALQGKNFTEGRISPPSYKASLYSPPPPTSKLHRLILQCGCFQTTILVRKKCVSVGFVINVSSRQIYEIRSRLAHYWRNMGSSSTVALSEVVLVLRTCLLILRSLYSRGRAPRNRPASMCHCIYGFLVSRLFLKKYNFDF